MLPPARPSSGCSASTTTPAGSTRSTRRRPATSSSYPWPSRAASCSRESAYWNHTLSRLGQVYRRSSLSHGALDHRGARHRGDQPVHRHPAQRLPHRAAHRPALRQAAGDHARRRSSTATSQALRRGVSMRTLYQHSARHSPATREYVAEISGPRRRGPHLGRVLQAAAGLRPAHRADPGDREPRRRGRDPRQVGRGLPRRHLRAGLGAGAAVHRRGARGRPDGRRGGRAR